MKNKLVFRILGALASALIVVSVFIPFISVTGYSPSLWETYEVTNSLYLPIMIIAFGAIGVMFFALNIKTEFAYMSTGAITFFLVMQTIDILDQGAFNTLGIGYYSLIVGTLLTGVMAFMTNLKTKQKIEGTAPLLTDNQPTMLDQIDKLYNDQAMPQNEISPIQPITNVVDPIPVQPIDSVEPISIQPAVSTEISSITIEQQVQQESNVVPVEPQQQVQLEAPVVQITTGEAQPQPVMQQPVNPVVQEFSNPAPTSPAIQEFSMPQVNSQQVVEPEVQSVVPQPNPVVNEFTNPTPTVESQQSSGLDIFGQ